MNEKHYVDTIIKGGSLYLQQLSFKMCYIFFVILILILILYFIAT